MIHLSDFYKLRLQDILAEKNLDLALFTQYLGRSWFGKTYYFTDCMQPITRPHQTHTLSVEFDRLTAQEIDSIFSKLKINISKHSTFKDVTELYGEPKTIQDFTPDRKTYIYNLPDGEFDLCFTILNNNSIAFFNMHTRYVSV